ncbi:MAG: BglG family transcription antiterminator [Candidatus Hodarchaeales archaeon]
MIKLDVRCRHILEKLLDNSSPVSALELSKSLNLTPRKVHYSLKNIGLWLAERDIVLEPKRGRGFQIKATAKEKILIKRELEKEPILIQYSQDYRRYYLIYSLLNSNTPIVIKQLTFKLNISRTTVISDLDWVDDWLKYFELTLIRKQNYGCFIEGMEKDKRNALITCVIENIGENKILEIIGNIKDSNVLSHQFSTKSNHNNLNFLPDLSLSYFVNLVDLVQDLFGERYTDESYILIVLHLAFLLNRVSKNQLIEDIYRLILEEHNENLYSFATTIAENISHSFNIKIPEQEVFFITHLLDDLKIKRSAIEEIKVDDDLGFTTDQVLEIVGQILNSASLYLHPTLKLDKDLIRSLFFHIVTIIDPSSNNYLKKNPILAEVKETYPDVFKVSKESGKCLEPILGRCLTDDEIGFIAMHLAAAMEKLNLPTNKRVRTIVVCNAGIATSNLLVTRIKVEFPELVVVGTMSFLEYQQQKDLVDFDLIISTLPIKEWDKPSILVSPLLEGESVERIRKSIKELLVPRRHNNNQISHTRGTRLDKLLLSTTISLRISVNTWEEVVDHAGELLLDISAIEPQYIQAMKRMHIMHGPFMVIKPGIALLHAFPNDGVKEVGMSMVTLNNPVSFGHKKFDPVSIVIALCTTDNESHIQALSDLVGLLQDKEAIKIIRSTVHKSRVLQFVKRHSVGK